MRVSDCCTATASFFSDDICGDCGEHAEFNNEEIEE